MRAVLATEVIGESPGPGPRLQLRHGPAEEGVHLLQLGCHDGVPHVEGVAGMVDPQEMPHEDVPVPLPPSRAPRELTAGVMSRSCTSKEGKGCESASKPGKSPSQVSSPTT